MNLADALLVVARAMAPEIARVVVAEVRAELGHVAAGTLVGPPAWIKPRRRIPEIARRVGAKKSGRTWLATPEQWASALAEAPTAKAAPPGLLREAAARAEAKREAAEARRRGEPDDVDQGDEELLERAGVVVNIGRRRGSR